MEAVCILPERDYRDMQSSISRIKSIQAKLITDSNREYLYTDEEFCQILKISKKTAQLWRTKGVVGFVQVGTVIRYQKKDIDALCEKFRIKAALK